MNLAQLLPELTLVVFAVIVIMLGIFSRREKLPIAVGILGLVVSGVISTVMWVNSAETRLDGMLAVDGFALFFKLLFLGVAALVLLASVDYAPKLMHFGAEYCALLLLATMGMMLMAASTELIFIYIALELTSISLYVLTGFLKDAKSTEASLKYLLLGAVASAVLLYGMALVFGFTGKTQLREIAVVIHQTPAWNLFSSPGLLLGLVFLIAGFGFKIAAVPFHMWVPDVYEGAPTPVTAYLSVASKAAGFAVILRVFYTAFELPSVFAENWGLVFASLSVISMTFGNIMAIPQSNINRLLGYSSIAQAGYLMVGLATVGVSPITDVLGRSGVLFFLASYAFTNLGAFIAIIAITNKIASDEIDDFSGMIKRAPLLSLALTLSLISLIGMPPAAGFVAKFFIFSGAVQHGLLWL
ncbi:MAG: NADH-quinone oxidoreductase subunit N, partial [Chloroflexi bacterium]|nr:NADH-quinone oxidoreductase subunit N [Chloroflexota bacterium]